MSRFIDLTGQSFGRWTVISRAVDGSGGTRWLVRCECGTEKEVYRGNLTSGKTTSCGCHQWDCHRTHGKGGSTDYKRWFSMIQRCTNPSHKAFPNYGGRGIGVSARWMSFENYYADMGPRPDGMTLDRIDNEGPYSPENCRWATQAEQNLNKRTNRFLTLNTKTQTVKEWATELGIRTNTLRSRINLGWSDERVLTTPLLR